jgi:hypothetical protein
MEIVEVSMADPLPELPQVAALSRLVERLWERDDVAALWLGGSFARGEADRYSDLDLRVAVLPEALPAWRRLDLGHLFSGECVGGLFHAFKPEGYLHQLVLAGGEVFDLWVQSVDRDPPQDHTLVLACRDEVFRLRLNEARPTLTPPPEPASGVAIQNLLANYWINSLKHHKLLARGLDLLVLIGIQQERGLVLRLWEVLATGRDPGSGRQSFHHMVDAVRAIDARLGSGTLELVGAAANDPTTIRGAIEELRDEVSHVGRLLAGSLGFPYPDALEEAVRRAWEA